MFINSAGVYDGLNFMLAPNGWDLANNYYPARMRKG